MSLRTFLVLSSLLLSFSIYGTECSDIFPGPQTFTTNSVDSIEGGTTCNGTSCSPGSFTSASYSFSSTGNFNQTSIVGGTTYAKNSWSMGENANITYSGTGTAIIYIKNNATIKKGAKINVGGNPANVLLIFNKKLKIEENAEINAFIYVNGSEANFEKDSVYNGGIAARTKLILKEDSTYNFTPSDADNIDAPSFCTAGPAETFHHLEIEHDGAGKTCTTETVTLKACTDAACSSVLSSAISLDFQVNGVTKGSASFTGTTTLGFDHNIAQWVSLSATNLSQAPTNGVTCDNGAGASCFMNFTAGVCTTACSDIFPGSHSFAANGASSIVSSNDCDGGSCTPVPTLTVPTLPTMSPSGSFNSTSISSGEYFYTTWGLGNGSSINFSGAGTSILYFNSSISIPKDTNINTSGSPSNVIIVVNGSFSLAKNANVNAHIYASGSISISKDATLNGAVSAGGSMTVAKDGNYTFSAADVSNLVGQNFCDGAAAPTLDHFLITHSGSGLTCSSSSITIKACTNAFGGTCTESTDAVSLDLLALGATHSVTNSVNFTGNTTVDLSYTVAETATLSITNESISASDGYKCNNDNVGDCDITFASAGFEITGFNDIEVAGENMLSGVNSRIYIQAVKDNAGVCEAYFDSPGTRNIDFAVKAVLPSTTGGNDYKINSNITPKYTTSPNTYQTIALDFDANSQAQLPINVYEDAGDLFLYAKHDIAATVDNPAITLVGNSSQFYVRPFEFSIEALTDGGLSLTNTLISGGTIEKAGVGFDLTISALNKQGVVTENFEQNVDVALQRTAPSSLGAEGVLIGDGNLAITSSIGVSYDDSIPFSDGKYESLTSATPATYDEVGLIKLYARETQTGSNSTNHATGELNIGRFVPAKFSLVANTVDNYCSNMTYMSQPAIELSYQVEAQNVAGDVTENYMKAVVFNNVYATVSIVAEDNAVTNLSHRLQDFTLQGSWNNGVYTNFNDVSGRDVGQLNRDTTIDGPYDNVRFGIKVEDPEGSELEGRDMLSSGGSFTAQDLSGIDSQIRFGRWVIDNAYGPETELLPVAMHLEYFDGTNFITNSLDDNCTAAIVGNKVLTGAIRSGGLAANEYRVVDVATTPSDSLTPADTNATTTGSFQLGHLIESPNLFNFSAPNKQGPLEFEYEVPVWFKFDWQDDGSHDDNPTGLLNFGLFRGNDRVISWREVGND